MGNAINELDGNPLDENHLEYTFFTENTSAIKIVGKKNSIVGDFYLFMSNKPQIPFLETNNTWKSISQLLRL